MDFPTLTRFIGAIRRTLPSHRIIIFGSSSLLASFPNDDPAQIGVLATLDADFFLDPEDAEMRKRLEAEFGEDNAYHAATGHYGDFVDLRLAELSQKTGGSGLCRCPVVRMCLA